MAVWFGWAFREAAVTAQAPPAWASTDQYDRQKIEGWSILVNKEFLAKQPELADKALELATVSALPGCQKTAAQSRRSAARDYDLG